MAGTLWVSMVAGGLMTGLIMMLLRLIHLLNSTTTATMENPRPKHDFIPIANPRDFRWLNGFKRLMRPHWFPPIEDVRCSYNDSLSIQIPRINLKQADARLVTSLRALCSVHSAQVTISYFETAIQHRFKDENDYSVPGITISDVENVRLMLNKAASDAALGDLSQDPEVNIPPEFSLSMNTVLGDRCTYCKWGTNSQRASERLSFQLGYPRRADFPKGDEGKQAFEDAREKRSRDYRIALTDKIEQNWRFHINEVLPLCIREPKHPTASAKEVIDKLGSFGFKDSSQWSLDFLYHLYVLSSMTVSIAGSMGGLDLARERMESEITQRQKSKAKKKCTWLLTQDLKRVITCLAGEMDKERAI
ncbi:hypothetical protein K490DRAFT_61732 [Saccharata proteae CBS 121410]|uniref:Uncharacterized protein n=1 Tax=Saccharata proteae CBS 121410 TaxID=1314787 RepID=A0A9P4LZ57_9PEZI|nr:hypothetical protein K490DRAFT_61732 [Saccharata proteae CBS 121410]